MQNQLENRVYAGFFVRLVAFAIDSLIATLAVSIVKVPFSIAALSGVNFLKANFIFQYSLLDVIGYVGIVAYFVLLTYITHTTPGKKMMRLEVITQSGEWTRLNILYRETIGRFLSSLLCIGYLAVFVQDKKQGFHDMLCDTFVVYKDVVPKMNTTVADLSDRAIGRKVPMAGEQNEMAGMDVEMTEQADTDTSNETTSRNLITGDTADRIAGIPHTDVSDIIQGENRVSTDENITSAGTGRNVVTPPVYHVKQAFDMPQSEQGQMGVKNSFDDTNPDRSNLEE